LTKKNNFFILILFAAFLSACIPSELKIQTAIAQTEAANPTATNTATPEPTATETPTTTPTLTQTCTPTLTNTRTPSPTPDERIIAEDPQLFLLDQEDLPIEGQYYAPNSTWISLETNAEVISEMTIEKGREYVINTGRVVGWFALRQRGTRTVRMPDEAGCDVTLHRSMKGAKYSLDEYGFFGDDWYEWEVEMDSLGDGHRIYIKKKVAPGGEKNTTYRIKFIYRNISVICGAYAYNEEDVYHEFVEDMARKTLEKLESAPLVSSEEAEAFFVQYQ
jgi:hypothetical protein